MDKTDLRTSKYTIDPDPFTIVSTFIGATAIILQFLDMRRASNSIKIDTLSRVSILHELENKVENILSVSRRLVRLIDRGVLDPEVHFFKVPYRVAINPMRFDETHHSQFVSALSEQYTALGHVSLWINHIIASDEPLAARIGDHLATPLAETAEHINRILAEGRSNREAIEQGMAALRALQGAIEQELRREN